MLVEPGNMAAALSPASSAKSGLVVIAGFLRSKVLSA